MPYLDENDLNVHNRSHINGSRNLVNGHAHNRKNEPIAITGFACRLPGSCNDPRAFWDFLQRGGIASLIPPASRFRLDKHNDNTRRPGTMASPGGMFLDIDPADIDAQFFKLSKTEAINMDPQQRQLLEVVYEAMENAGVTLDAVRQRSIGCFVASFAGDYGDIQARDPEDRASGAALGIGRAMLSNRISHFLDITGPSMTVDTACSGSLTCVDIACKYLQSGEMDGAIVGGSNIYLSPEHVMGTMSTSGYASGTGRCHTFDAKADGYIKAEAVNAVLLKRLDDAIRDGDPIRGIIRGTATGSDGWTAGISSPNSVAQATTIRQAYLNAQISDYSATSYVECHGTGTKAGDVIEVTGLGLVFNPTQRHGNALRIGSVKSNLGHSEPAAGITAMIKTLLSMEHGIIPGNPTFIAPNPAIDFSALGLRASRTSTKWPVVPFRRAGINSFGYGGSNAHCIVDEAGTRSSHVSSYLGDDDDQFEDAKLPSRPYILFISANDQTSIEGACSSLNRHLSNPAVRVEMRDIAYTLSARRSKHYHRGFAVVKDFEIELEDFAFAKTSPDPPRIGFVFTGQGAQWSQMGKLLIATFPEARRCIEELDVVLRKLPNGPKWTLLGELTEPRSAAHMRLPEFSQPLVTALQLAILAVLNSCAVNAQSVIGHSSGEIAAAVAAGSLTPAQAITIAFYRGVAASNPESGSAVGMLAVGITAKKAQQYLASAPDVEIACFNSPASLTLSGNKAQLEDLERQIKADGQFARLLTVDAAYHSSYMAEPAVRYRTLMSKNCDWTGTSSNRATMFSSVTGQPISDHVRSSAYWETNMKSPVFFDQAAQTMLQQPIDVLIEIGPSDALAGPCKQIIKSSGKSVEYLSSWKRGPSALETLCELAGNLAIRGSHIDLTKFNADHEQAPPRVVVDLPNYAWNHTVKYWHESDSSKDWRFRKFLHHDILGSKILGTPWMQPMWRKVMRLKELPWLEDHKFANNIVFPAAGFVAMATEAIYQMGLATGVLPESTRVSQATYLLRNITIERALIIDPQGAESKVVLSLSPLEGTREHWYRFRISSIVEEVLDDHCKGLIRLSSDPGLKATYTDIQPLKHSEPAAVWYKAMLEKGYQYGPLFQTQLEVESREGAPGSRSIITLTPPKSIHAQSEYSLHPATIDGCFQSVAAALWQGARSSPSRALLPAKVDEILIPSQSTDSTTGIAVIGTEYSGVGRRNDAKSKKSNVSLYDPEGGRLLFRFTGLHAHPSTEGSSAPDTQTYCHSVWQPDVTKFSRTQLNNLLIKDGLQEFYDTDRTSWEKIYHMFDLLVFRKPDLEVLEIDMTGDGTSIWIDRHETNIDSLSQSCRLVLSVPQEALYSAAPYGKYPAVSIIPHTPTELFDYQSIFDIIIIRTSGATAAPANFLQEVRKLLGDKGVLVTIDGNSRPGSSPPKITDATSPTGYRYSLELKFDSIHRPMESQTEYVLKVAFPEYQAAHMLSQDVEVLQIGQSCEKARDVLEQLSNLGWRVHSRSSELQGITPHSTVLIVDELFDNVLSDINNEQWTLLQRLVALKCRILWVTKDSQMSVKNPTQGLIRGIARTIREETPEVVLMTLDIESESSRVTAGAIDEVLKQVKVVTGSANIDSEFVERNGLLHIERVLKDDILMKHQKARDIGAEPTMQPLFENEACVRLVSKRVGTLDNLVWEEIPEWEILLADDHVEVDIHAVGINFKDIAISMGLIAGDERLIGLEGAGIIRRVGKAVKNLHVGQRVLANKKGALANRVQCESIGEVYPLPDWLSFEAASCCHVVYSTVIYSLVDLANLQRGQSILIHSAAGGVGLAAISFSKHIGADIYCTVGNDEKRAYLMKEHGIPSDRIFSSRSTAFAAQLMKATGGLGVDCILNSLSGDLLHESWRCIATSGTFIEISKKDILDRNTLSMEPFGRNASYRAVDMSHDCFTPALKHRLITQWMTLLEQGFIKLLPITRTFGFDDIQAAFRHMRGGNNIGKTVISRRESPSELNVSVRPAIARLPLKSESAYLIVGGLKGICGSLALYLAREGAKNLVIMSRSDCTDEVSKRVIANLKSLKANITLVKGDVTVKEDVRRAFESSTCPIAGVVHGAMVLKDKLYSTMTYQEFHDAIRPKVQGSWNLHEAALETSCTLDFFTMLSSLCGVFGGRAQANYSAANVFLDAFATYRNSLGLAANSIDLGIIEDVGYLDQQEKEHQYRRLVYQGWERIGERSLCQLLALSIFQQSLDPINPDSRSQMITGIPVPVPDTSPARTHARFSTLRVAAIHDAHLDANQVGDSPLATVQAAIKDPNAIDRTVLLQMIETLANQKFRESLGLEEPLDPGRPLSSYGIDSLVAVEFWNWAKSDLGVEITTVEVIAAKTLASFSETLLSKIVGVSTE